jgi:hypothetical protein
MISATLSAKTPVTQFLCLSAAILFLVLKLANAQTITWAEVTVSGRHLQAQGLNAEAETAFRYALEKAGEPRSVATSLNDLATVLEAGSGFSEAEQLYRCAVRCSHLGGTQRSA